MIERAQAADSRDITDLINRAYEVEKFFVKGDRIEQVEVERFVRAGRFFRLRSDAGALLACIYYREHSDHAYFGMLAVDPAARGQQLGRRLITFVEARARLRGFARMRILVVNLRDELPPWYRRLGYAEVGTEPFEDPRRIQPAHFLVFEKELAPHPG